MEMMYFQTQWRVHTDFRVLLITIKAILSLILNLKSCTFFFGWMWRLGPHQSGTSLSCTIHDFQVVLGFHDIMTPRWGSQIAWSSEKRRFCCTVRKIGCDFHSGSLVKVEAISWKFVFDEGCISVLKCSNHLVSREKVERPRPCNWAKRCKSITIWL